MGKMAAAMYNSDQRIESKIISQKALGWETDVLPESQKNATSRKKGESLFSSAY
jgi:hypothetical protein